MKRPGKLAKSFQIMNILSVHISSSGCMYILLAVNGDYRCYRYRSVNRLALAILSALLKSDYVEVIAQLRDNVGLHNLRPATSVDLSSINCSSLLLSVAVSEFAEMMPETLFVNNRCLLDLANRARRDFFICDESGWKSCSEYFHGIRDSLGMQICWPVFCAAHGSGIVDTKDLPPWVESLIAQYEKPKDQYKLIGQILVDTEAQVYGVTGAGLILGSISKVTDCYLSGSFIYSSTVHHCDIESGYVLWSTAEESTFLNSFVDGGHVKRSDINRSIVRATVAINTSITESYLSYCAVRDSQITSSFCYWPNRSLDIQSWTLNDTCISNLESYELTAKRFKKSRLSRKVHDYYCKDANLLQSRAAAGEFIYGIELEVLTRSNEAITYKPSYCRIKPDSSLPVGGLEIVTRPDSMEVHLRNLRRMLRINKLTIGAECGMHVHVPFKAAKAKAIKERIYKNKTKYYRIAGRKENRYCAYDPGNERYQAVNANGDTIEFRLFSGTVNIHKIKRRLQWVRAMCEWSNKVVEPKQEAKYKYVITPEQQGEWAFQRLESNFPATFTWDSVYFGETNCSAFLEPIN